MAKRAKRRTFCGGVLTQEVYTVPDRAEVTTYKYKPRFQDEEERARHRWAQSRRHHADVINNNYGPSSYYSTLTFDNEYEVHSFDEARRLRDNYVRRLKRLYPDAKINIYMGRGRKTARIHFHMISDGVDPDDIMRKWVGGSVIRVEPLRAHNIYDGVDHGRDYTGLANYCFDHWTPEQGDGRHRWKQTKNVEQPTPEPAQEIHREYSPEKPPRAPKGFRLVECRATKFGYLSFKYIKDFPEDDAPYIDRQKRGREPRLSSLVNE